MKLRASKRTVIASVAVVATALATVAGIQVAQAGTNEEQAHHYIQLGGTGMWAEDPECTRTYEFANEAIDIEGAGKAPICYPASIAPFVGSQNEMPAPEGAASYDDSIQQGVEGTIAKIHEIHEADPNARITISGYSLGADVADRVLEMIANGEVDVPKELFAGKLYADPRQPETGLWAKIPAGASIAGITSPGPGPMDFDGIPVERHCMAKDLICDAAPNPENVAKYFTEHSDYQIDDHIMEQTITEPATNEIIWHE